ncbi:MAG: hypothetical protein PHY54_08870 [Methylococcales bacterium]|nr:hypothetical protein [Methylococcales bacterium]
MQETEGDTLAVKATERLTSQDYENVFIPRLNRLIEKFGKIRVVFYLAEILPAGSRERLGMMPHLA